MLSQLGRSLFTVDGLSFEERRRFDAAMLQCKQQLDTYERAMQAYESAEKSAKLQLDAHSFRAGSLLDDLESARAVFHRDMKEREAALTADTEALEKLLENAQDSTPSGIAALAEQVWLSIPLPVDFPRGAEAKFDAESGALLMTVEAPDFERVPLTTALKASRKAVSDCIRRTYQQRINHILPLRLTHEIFATPELAGVKLVGVNVRLAYIDRRDGRSRHEIVASMMTTREEFERLELAEVDPKPCFRSLRGVETVSYEQIAPIQPLLTFDRDDGRIIEGRQIVDSLEVATNLAAMDWEEFEHVVRELFAKLFTARSEAAEVHVTRASRDYGVDALVYDPDPIMGGKYVIQAKRYTNTVDVAAVRDLFGTVQNEGASKGFLVTTSSFGPDSHSFAKGKPLTLIDGQQLLRLLEAQGYHFRIDLSEARRILRGD